jgi:hypothetical protein
MHVAPSFAPFSVPLTISAVWRFDIHVICDCGCRLLQSVRIADVRLQNGKVLRFEVRFGANATSKRFASPPPSGMIQVNLDDGNTRVVVEQSRP